MFRLAHLTDPHVGPLPRVRLRQLMSKRFTGWLNWHRGRQGSHDMEILAALVSDMREREPDHIVCTGDVCNIGLPSEWATSRVFLEGLGTAEGVSFVPGNHDAYVPGSLEGLLREIGPYVSGDVGADRRFPYLRRRGPVALVGLSSAVPTAPFIASGTAGRIQLEAAERMLAELGGQGLCRVVLIHHPPHRKGAPPGRNLTDARDFEAMIARVGAELVLHGHNHTGSVAFIPCPGGKVPVVGAPSASSRGGTLTHPAGYFMFTITETEGRFAIAAEHRGLTPQGTIGDLGVLPLS
jgi:3',5'-cyclic AMP phosphodiesterase CpdA